MEVAGSLPSGTDNPWRDPVTDPSAFCKAFQKSTVKNVNNNKPRNRFVFGHGSAGMGYYSLDTRDAYKIMYLRLKIREAHARSQLTSFDCSNCLFLGCRPSTTQIHRKEELSRKCEELAAMAAFVKAKLNAAGPDVTANADSVSRGMDKSRSTDVSRNALGHDAYPQYHNTTIWVAAGCGGGKGPGGSGCGYGWMSDVSLVDWLLGRFSLFFICCLCNKEAEELVVVEVMVVMMAVVEEVDVEEEDAVVEDAVDSNYLDVVSIASIQRLGAAGCALLPVWRV